MIEDRPRVLRSLGEGGWNQSMISEEGKMKLGLI